MCMTAIARTRKQSGQYTINVWRLMEANSEGRKPALKRAGLRCLVRLATLQDDISRAWEATVNPTAGQSDAAHDAQTCITAWSNEISSVVESL